MVTGCDECSDGLLQSSIIIGIVVWLLMLTIFFLVLLIVLLITAVSVHDDGRGQRQVRPADAGPPASATTAAVVGPSGGTERSAGVHRRISSTRLYLAEPWMNALAENVWKDYEVETINDT